MNTPTVLLYGQNKNHPFEFRGIYSANPLSIFIKNFCDDNGYGERNTFQDVQPDAPYLVENFRSAKIDYGVWARSRRLNLDTFENTVINDDKNVWVVSFINPSCDACKRFVPHWD